MLQHFLQNPPKNLFFTGKGGVGKTTTAAATAIALADDGKQVLLVSTDPASNLDEVLSVALGSEPRAIPEVPNLFALNVDPETAAAAYRNKWSVPIAGSCRMRPCAAWKSSFPEPAPWRSQRSMSLPR